jgi:hypothetical protein
MRLAANEYHQIVLEEQRYYANRMVHQVCREWNHFTLLDLVFNSLYRCTYDFFFLWFPALMWFPFPFSPLGFRHCSQWGPLWEYLHDVGLYSQQDSDFHCRQAWQLKVAFDRTHWKQSEGKDVHNSILPGKASLSIALIVLLFLPISLFLSLVRSRSSSPFLSASRFPHF